MPPRMRRRVGRWSLPREGSRMPPLPCFRPAFVRTRSVQTTFLAYGRTRWESNTCMCTIWWSWLRPRLASRGSASPPARRSALSDWELIVEIRAVLAETPFVGERHGKVRARLTAEGMAAGRNGVLRLIRENGLLAPRGAGHLRGNRSHGGRIRTGRPDELWGTDAARFRTRAEGWCWFFVAVDHCVTDVVGWHGGGAGGPLGGVEPVRRGVRTHMGASRRRSPRGSASGTTGARSTGRGRSGRRSRGSGSAPHPRTSVSPSATGR